MNPTDIYDSALYSVAWRVKGANRFEDLSDEAFEKLQSILLSLTKTEEGKEVLERIFEEEIE